MKTLSFFLSIILLFILVITFRCGNTVNWRFNIRLRDNDCAPKTSNFDQYNNQKCAECKKYFVNLVYLLTKDLAPDENVVLLKDTIRKMEGYCLDLHYYLIDHRSLEERLCNEMNGKDEKEIIGQCLAYSNKTFKYQFGSPQTKFRDLPKGACLQLKDSLLLHNLASGICSDATEYLEDIIQYTAPPNCIPFSFPFYASGKGLHTPAGVIILDKNNKYHMFILEPLQARIYVDENGEWLDYRDIYELLKKGEYDKIHITSFEKGPAYALVDKPCSSSLEDIDIIKNPTAYWTDNPSLFLLEGELNLPYTDTSTLAFKMIYAPFFKTRGLAPDWRNYMLFPRQPEGYGAMLAKQLLDEACISLELQ